MTSSPTKTILVTGSTDGIGYETAKQLVEMGHRVLLHGRNSEKLASVVNKLSAMQVGQISSFTADLSDLTQVEALANNILKKQQYLDVIINNAGIYKTEHPILNNGLDIRFMVNTYAPYLLTQKLLTIMDGGGRIINLSSAAQAPVKLSALNGKTTVGDDFSAYAQSKLAITMWTNQLASQKQTDSPLLVSINPGSLLATKMVKEGFGVAGNDISIGSDILIRAALSDEFENANGLYFDNDAKQFSQPHPDALNTEKCQKLLAAMHQYLGRRPEE